MIPIGTRVAVSAPGYESHGKRGMVLASGVDMYGREYIQVSIHGNSWRFPRAHIVALSPLEQLAEAADEP